MNKEKSEIIEVFNKIIKNIYKYPIFKNNRNTLIRELNEAIEELYAQMTCQMLLSSEANILNNAIDSYRTILKFIMKNSNEENVDIFTKDKIIANFLDLFNEFAMKFNEIRNRIDRYKLNLVQLHFDKISNTIEEVSEGSTRRAYIRGKQLLNIDRNDTSTQKFLWIEYFLQYPKKIKKEKYLTFFRSQNRGDIIDSLFQLCLIDSEIVDDINFNDFTYFDVIKISAALLYVAIYKVSSNLVNYKENNDQKEYRFEMKESQFIKILSQLSNVNIEKTKFIINYMIYDSEYHENKITLLQHLIKVDENIVFSPISIIFADIAKKFYRVFTDKDRLKYEKQISEIAHVKEIRMINEIVENYKDSKNLILKHNFRYKKGKEKNVSAEYDLVFYDTEERILLLCECKWFYVGDGELDHLKLDKKLRSAIKDRKLKDRCVYENTGEFMQKCFGKRYEVFKIHSLLLSNNYEGDIETSSDFPVVDLSTFKYVSVQEKFKVAKVIKAIKNNSYLEMIDSTYIQSEFEYHSYKFKLARIAVSNTLGIK